MRFKLSLLASVAFMMFSCRKSQLNYPVTIIGHAGSGLDVELNHFPENTNESVRNAVLKGARAVELDVQLAADNNLVLFHDNFLISRTSCQGCIPSMNYSMFQSCYYGVFPSFKIELLTDIDLSGIDEVFLDLRHMNFCTSSVIDSERYLEALESFVLKHPDKRIVMMSPSVNLLTVLRVLPVELAFVHSDISTIITVLSTYNFDMAVMRNKYISTDEVRQIQKMGKKVIIFDAKSFEGNKSALEKLPDYLMTDDLVSGVALTE